MIFDKELEVQIDLKTPQEIYGDIDLVVRQKLEDDFTNKCYYGVLILEIKEIIERSKCQITDAANTGYGFISVRFIASVYQANSQEMIMGKVLMVEDNRIQCLEVDNRAAMMLRRAPGIRGIKKDQIIPIRVERAAYTISRSQIPINGTLYIVPKKPAEIYNISPLKKEERVELEPLLNEIKVLESQLGKIDKKTVSFFNSLLYPFVKVDTVSGATKKDMKKLDASGLVVRHERINKLTPQIYILKKAPPKVEVFEQSAVGVYQIFLIDYMIHLRSVILLCQTYKKDDIRKKHSNLWEIYKAYKKLVPPP